MLECIIEAWLHEVLHSDPIDDGILPFPAALSAESPPKPHIQQQRHTVPVISDASTVSSRSKRSASPVKKVGALHQTGGGIFYRNVTDAGDELGQTGQELLWDLVDVASGFKTIPQRLWDGDEAFRGEFGHRRVQPSVLDEGDERGLDELLRELEVVREINQQSRRCEEECEGEFEWNMAVHSRLLHSVFGVHEDAGVGFRYMASDKIDPQWLPRHSTGLSFSSRMVDFGIYLAGNTPCNGPQTLQERLASAPYLTSPSINHTNRLSLQAKPLAISIETKTISRTEEEARVQLGVWIASQIERLKRLCLEPSPVLAETVFPLLFVQSAQWTVMFARVDPENLNRVYINTGPRIGDTSTLKGIYCLLAGLRCLRNFVAKEYNEWWYKYLDEVLLDVVE